MRIRAASALLRTLRGTARQQDASHHDTLDPAWLQGMQQLMQADIDDHAEHKKSGAKEGAAPGEYTAVHHQRCLRGTVAGKLG